MEVFINYDISSVFIYINMLLVFFVERFELDTIIEESEKSFLPIFLRIQIHFLLGKETEPISEHKDWRIGNVERKGDLKD